jgi:hypothetical protein
VQVQVDELRHGIGRVSLPQMERRKGVEGCAFRGLTVAIRSKERRCYAKLAPDVAASCTLTTALVWYTLVRFVVVRCAKCLASS